MKNLFDYARKELSQDGFLSWLFENYNCDEDVQLKAASNNILKKFCGIEDDEKIADLITYRQFHKIDIAVRITTDKRIICLYVEDKALSQIHNDQLKRYNEIIAKFALPECGESSLPQDNCKVYYKTDEISASELNIVKRDGWVPYDIHSACEIFRQYSGSDNLILGQYIEHIGKIKSSVENVSKPNDNSDLLAWRAYFNKTKIELPRGLGYEVGIYRNLYTYLQIFTDKRRDIPYIEIRSRNCGGDTFKAVILSYGKISADCRESLYRQIARRKSGLFKAEAKWNERRKQLGVYRNFANSDREFIDRIKLCIDDYLSIMQHSVFGHSGNFAD